MRWSRRKGVGESAAPAREELPADAARGWDAIDAALRPIYGDQVPAHVSYGLGQAFGDALQGCSAYRRDDHWHYVTYGLSNLFAEPQEEILNAAGVPISGWGFEFTFRLRGGTEDSAPRWPFNTLLELAKHVMSGHPLCAGDRIDVRAAITGFPTVVDAPNTDLTVCALTVDPELGEIIAPDGVVTFLQVVGVTAETKAEMVATRTADVLERLAIGNPLLITTL